MERIVFLDSGSFGKNFEFSSPEIDHELIIFESTEYDDVATRLEGATIAITNKVPIERMDLSDPKLSNLKLILVAATGYNVIDTDACKEKGIAVYNVQGYAINTVPEHTFSMILSLRRQLFSSRADVNSGNWRRSKNFCVLGDEIRDLHGSTIGIIGAGAIGGRVCEIASAFGMNVLVAAPVHRPPKDGETSLENVLINSDIISIHCPLNSLTRNLISEPEFKLMKRKPLIVNTARGGIVNEGDLVSAYKSGLVSAIGFDCLTEEPPVNGNPLLEISDQSNVLVTPHTAWASREAMNQVWSQVIGNIQRFLNNDPVNKVV